MQKFLEFMKSPKGVVLTALVLLTGLIFAFTSHKNSVGDGDKRKLLTMIGNVLEQQHYSPQKINDEFSKKVFRKTIEELDPDKNIFLAPEINSLKKYETTIDDEIKGGDLQFEPALNLIFNKDIPEVVALYKEILSHPFNFEIDETFSNELDKNYQSDEFELSEPFSNNSGKGNFPSNEAARKEKWRKKLKYLTLERFVELQDQREKNKKDSSVSKPDSVLEKDARARVLKSLDRTYERIRLKFTDDERFNAFVNVITNLMDPHTDFFPPVEKRNFDEQMSNRFYGIGAQLQETEGNIKITSLLTGGPAWKSGEILANDVIIKVAQGAEAPVDITGFDVTDAVKLIRGNKGTEVRLTLKRMDGTIKVVTLIRDEIVQDESFARSAIIKDGSTKIGYIYLPDFYADFDRPNGSRCSEDVAKEINKLKAENVNGVVIDLRFNGGGSLYEVVQMVGLFIEQGPVVQVRDKDGRSTIMSDRDGKLIYDGPLAVMVNEGSASASEIFAAAIQDYKRGIIIGSTSTYGKGTVQKMLPLGNRMDFFSDKSEMGALKLTFQKFYRINGGATQLKGVTPDIVLPDVYENLKIREKDNAAALSWDEIAKAPFQIWKNGGAYDQVIKKYGEEVKENNNFKFIKSNTEWISKRTAQPISLMISKYREQQKSIRSTVEQSNSLSKLSEAMNVSIADVDKDKFYNNPDKPKGDRYQAWLKGLKNDLYINESVKIVEDMIAAEKTGTVIK